MAAPPTPATRSSRRGNGEPEKNTAARSSEASSSERRYSARIRSFSLFFVVRGDGVCGRCEVGKHW